MVSSPANSTKCFSSDTRDVIIDFHWANPSASQKLRMLYIDFLGLFKPYENDTVTHDKDAPFDHLEVDP